jgi:L-threonylcarbamoyladenylate synthase
MRTQILKPSQKTIQTAVAVLKKGGIVIYPTETAYAIGADSTNRRAENKIYKIKGREKRKRLSVIVSDIEMAKKYVKLSPHAMLLAKKFMPGPLTLVCPRKKSKQTLAWRISSNPIARRLSAKLGKPITATSANLSGKRPIYDPRALEIFKGKVDIIIDAGNLPKRKVSTIFDVQRKKILRRGPITKAQILKILK